MKHYKRTSSDQYNGSTKIKTSSSIMESLKVFEVKICDLDISSKVALIPGKITLKAIPS